METGAQEEVAAFASRLDNQVRKAKVRGTALLPDEGVVDKQLKVLFWEGLKGPIKDKARHRKDQCQSFAELITAATYGEKEAYGSNEAKYIGRAQQSVVQEPGESARSNADKPNPNGLTRCYKKLKQWPLPLRLDKMNSHQKGGDINPGDQDGLGVTHLLAFVVGKLVT